VVNLEKMEVLPFEEDDEIADGKNKFLIIPI